MKLPHSVSDNLVSVPGAKTAEELDIAETQPLLTVKAPLTSNEAPAEATPAQLAVNLVTCGLGTGIFTLPWSTAGASIIPAVFIIGFVLALNAWTMSIIVAAGERHHVFNLGSLLARLPGRTGSIAEAGLNSFIWLSTLLCLISYIILIADCLHSSGFMDFIENKATLVAMASTVVLPLCFLDQRRLSFTSTLTVAATLNIFLLIFWQAHDGKQQSPHTQKCLFALSPGSVAMCSAMMQTIVIQACVLPMYEELKDRSPAKFNSIVCASFAALFVLFTAFSVVGYYVYGQGVSSNVILNLPSTPWGRFSRLCAAAAVAGVYPIMVKPMVAPLQGTSSMSNAAVVLIVLASLFGALQSSDLGYINVVNGALSCGAFVGLTPSLVGLYLMGPESKEPAFRTAMISLAFFGCAFSIVGLKMTDNYSSALSSACTWGIGA